MYIIIVKIEQQIRSQVKTLPVQMITLSVFNLNDNDSGLIIILLITLNWHGTIY